MSPRARTAPFRLDLRDGRIPGGRLSLSLRTTHRPTAARRESAVRRLVDASEWDVLERLRRREIRVEDVTAAVEAGDVARIRPAVSSADYTLGREIDRLLETVPPASRPNYESCTNALLDDFGPGYPMERLTRDEAAAWLRAPKKRNGNKPWAASRRALARTLLGRLWSDAIHRAEEAADATGDRPALRRNPWSQAGPRRGTRETIQPRQAYLQPAEWQRLLAHVWGTQRAVFYALCTLGGLRRGEALNLRMGLDLDLPPEGRGMIRIQPRTGAHAWTPKTKRSIRDVPISPELRRIIDHHIELGYAGERYLLHPPGADRPFSGHTPPAWARVDFPAVGIPYGRAGESSVTIHSLRHSCASWMVQRDVSIIKVARILGDTVAMIERVYGHLAPTDLGIAADAAGAASVEGS